MDFFERVLFRHVTLRSNIEVRFLNGYDQEREGRLIALTTLYSLPICNASWLLRVLYLYPLHSLARPQRSSAAESAAKSSSPDSSLSTPLILNPTSSFLNRIDQKRSKSGRLSLSLRVLSLRNGFGLFDWFTKRILTTQAKEEHDKVKQGGGKILTTRER